MSSSSLCECGSDCSCSRAPRMLHNSKAFLFSQQPLVYYAEVADPYSTKNKGQKNTKPNCFVRAFRWYTQDHGRFKMASSENKDVGFAAWLDQKYEQYLRDSQLNATPKSEVSSTVEPLINQATPKSDKRKGIQKSIKSPWKKRRASSKSPEGEYSRDEKGPTMYYTSSKVTVVSSDTQVSARTYSKIRGIVVQEIPARENSVAKSENNLGDKKPTAAADTSNSQHTYVLGENNRKTSKNKLHCECPVEPKESARTRTIDANTQYDPNTNITEEKPIDKITISRVATKSSHPQTRLDSTKNTHVREGHTKIDDREQNKPKPISTIGGKPQCSQKSIRGPSTRINSHFHGAAQTSDYAINLGNCTCDCPLLVRIVKARQ